MYENTLHFSSMNGGKYICYILLPNEEKNEVSNAITVDDWAIFLHMM